jgi:hypothetical protein
MINFKEWRKKSLEGEIGKYKVKVEDIGNGKILITASNSEQLIDSKKEVKKVVDFSELEEPKTNVLALSSPAMEPMDTRNNFQPAT